MVRPGRRSGPPSTIELPALAPFYGGILEGGGEYEGLAFEGLDLSGQAAERASFRECRITRCALDGVSLARSSWWGCLVEEVRAASLDAAGSTWHEVLVRDARIGALSAIGAAWTDVRIRGGRIDYLVLAGARVRDLVLEGCVVGELDLAGAEVRDLVVDGGALEVLDVGESRLSRLDLRRTRLGQVRGPGGLRGAVIAPEQLFELAPVLADHLGIVIEPG